MSDFLQDRLPTATQCVESLRQEHKILAEIDLNRAESENHSWLWRQISPLYQPVFRPEELILCFYQGPTQQDLIDHLQKILALRDISNDFMMIITDDPEIESKVLAAKIYSTDLMPIAYRMARFLPHRSYTDRQTDFHLPQTMCLAPWAKLEIKPDGRCQPCCVIAEPIRDDTGKSMTVQEHGMEQIYHSRFLKDLRSQLRHGSKPSVCQQCWDDESVNRKSVRQHILWDLKDEQFNLDWDVESTQNLRSWHLALGNTCNLKCRVCDATSSSKWAAELLTNIDTSNRKNDPIYKILQQTGWAEQSDCRIWQDIESSISHIKELRFTGGEPLLIKKQFEVMDRIARTEHAKDISLVYTTNATVMFPEPYVDRLRHFRNVSISLSIDDIAKRFEYQRSGAKWTEVIENFRSYQSLRRLLPNFTLKINCTVSIMNAYYLPEFLDWLDQHHYDFLRFNVLARPSVLSISHVTPSFQKAVLDRLRSRLWADHVQEQIDSICCGLEKAQQVDGHEFVQYIAKVDQRRQEDFAITHPEVAAMMGYRSLSI